MRLGVHVDVERVSCTALISMALADDMGVTQFHISCLNLPANQSLPDTWFCDECSALLGKTNTMTQTTGGPSGGRKGRKK